MAAFANGDGEASARVRRVVDLDAYIAGMPSPVAPRPGAGREVQTLRPAPPAAAPVPRPFPGGVPSEPKARVIDI